MGNCCGGAASAPPKGPAGRPIQGGGGGGGNARTGRDRVGSMMSTTGIMDEDAPVTTAPKLDETKPEVQAMIERVMDVLKGEKLVIDRRLAVGRKDDLESIRMQTYEQIILILREVIHKLNEAGLDRLGVCLPSHVYEMLQIIKHRCVAEGTMLFPTLPTKRTASCKALDSRKAPISEYLRLLCLEDGGMNPSGEAEGLCHGASLYEFCTGAELKLPPRCLLAAREKGGGKLGYLDIMDVWSERRRRNLEPLRRVFEEYATNGFLAEHGFASFVKARPPTLPISDPSREFQATLVDQDVRKVQRDRWSEQEFFGFLLNPAGRYSGLRRSLTSTVYQAMDRPLWEYHINTSKNTWLAMRDLLTSDSSTDMIRDTLLSGVRVVELDCHDGPDGKPIVRLAWTKNKPLPLLECLETIRDHAFTASAYPVILSLSFHIGREADCASQMTKAAVYLKDTFQERLVRWSNDHAPPDAAEMTPAKLRGKIIVEATKRDQEIARVYRSSTSMGGAALTSPLERRQSECFDGALEGAGDSFVGGDAGSGGVRIGLTVVGTKNKVGVRVKAVAGRGAADRAGIRENSYVEEITVGTETRRVRTPEDLQEMLRVAAEGGEDELRIKADQMDYRIVLGHSANRPLASCASVSGDEGDDSPEREEPPTPDSSEDDKPEVLLRLKRCEVQAAAKSGRPYKRCPVDSHISRLTALVKRKYTGASRSLSLSLVPSSPPPTAPAVDAAPGSGGGRPRPLIDLAQAQAAQANYFEVVQVVLRQYNRMLRRAGIRCGKGAAPAAAVPAGSETPGGGGASLSQGRDLAQLVGQAERQLLHLFPDRDAMASENFSPIHAWEAGIQMVAAHHQRCDQHLLCGRAFFEDNGGCGYVLRRRRDAAAAGGVRDERDSCYDRRRVRVRVLLADGLRYTEGGARVAVYFAGQQGEQRGEESPASSEPLTPTSGGAACCGDAPWHSCVEASEPSDCNAWDKSFVLDIQTQDEALPYIAKVCCFLSLLVLT